MTKKKKRETPPVTKSEPLAMTLDEVENLLHRMSISEYNVTGGSVRKYTFPTEHYRLELRIPVDAVKSKSGPRSKIDPD